MKILITGSKGFVGKNLVSRLNEEGIEYYEYNSNSSNDDLLYYCKNVDFVFHLAGVNRPSDASDFIYNKEITKKLIETLEKCENTVPVVYSSSVQAEKDNDYGISKKDAENHLFEYGKRHNVEIFVYRLNNIFGKWSKPNYKSVVATYCNNISRDLPIKIDNSDEVIPLIYIDDVIDEFLFNMKYNSIGNSLKPIYLKCINHVKVGELADLIYRFKESKKINLQSKFISRLYSTYLSYAPDDQLLENLVIHKDERGFFAEIFKSDSFGQVSVNVSKPGIKKGEHWHQTKIEKFCVVKGKALVQIRDIFEKKITEFRLDDTNIQIINIPPGSTHNLINIGQSDLITLIWANELFDVEKPDTFYLKVNQNE